MSLKTEKDKEKQLQDKCQSVLNALLRDDDNKYCVDCDSKGRLKKNQWFVFKNCLLKIRDLSDSVEIVLSLVQSNL
mgnify:CR=1 FL=1